MQPPRVADGRINLPVDIPTERAIETIEDVPRRHGEIVCCNAQRTTAHHLSFT